MTKWDEALYLKFGNERTRPALELCRRVPLASVATAVDLGCGTGNSTAVLRERWPDARIIGVDSSEEMLAKARADAPEAKWIRADLRAFRPSAPVDVVFSNAVLHWLPDHASLIPRPFRMRLPGRRAGHPDAAQPPRAEPPVDARYQGAVARANRPRGRPHAGRKPHVLLRSSRPQRRERRHLGDPLRARDARCGRYRRMGRGQRPAALPRSADRPSRTSGVPRNVHESDRRRLPASRGR